MILSELIWKRIRNWKPASLAELNSWAHMAEEIQGQPEGYQALKDEVAKLHAFQHSVHKRDSVTWWGRSVVGWIIDYATKLEAQLVKHSDAVAGAQLFAVILKDENEGLREFWSRLCRHIHDFQELDGETFQDWGEELGLLRMEIYDPNIHDLIGDADPGDEIFVNALAKMEDKDATRTT